MFEGHRLTWELRVPRFKITSLNLSEGSTALELKKAVLIN
jgi:hypothetical protein